MESTIKISLNSILHNQNVTLPANLEQLKSTYKKIYNLTDNQLSKLKIYYMKQEKEEKVKINLETDKEYMNFYLEEHPDLIQADLEKDISEFFKFNEAIQTPNLPNVDNHNNCLKDHINNEMNGQINDKINSKIKLTSGSNYSSSYKPSIELYINEDNLELNDESLKNNENQRYLLNKENENVDKDNKINNIKVNRNYSNNKNPIHFLNLNRPKSFKKGENNENIIYNNDMCNKKKYFNIHDGLLIENSYYIDKNASSNECENKSKVYINKIIKNNGGDSEYSIKKIVFHL